MRHFRPVRPLQRSFPEMLAERFSQAAEANEECVSCRWSALTGFQIVTTHAGDDGEPAELVLPASEAEVLAETARMLAEAGG